MIRALAVFALCLAMMAQQFDVTSVKPSPDASSDSSGIRTGHGRLDARNVTVKRCIMGAYNRGPHQIEGGPDWIASDRFQIQAKADQPVNDDAAIMVMLPGLLADRFKLVVHRDTRTLPAYVLEVDNKGAKLEAAEQGESSTNTSSHNSGVSINAHHADMDSFARVLARTVDYPVVNRSGLKGLFQLTRA